MATKVLFLIPPPLEGSGGHRTILRHASYLASLEKYEVACFVSDPDPWRKESMAGHQQKIFEWFSISNLDLINDLKDAIDFDVVVATAWWTVYVAGKLNLPIIYFVQDLENLFNPAGTNSVMASFTYTLGLNTITIGKWLRNQTMINGGSSTDTPFGINPKNYYLPEKSQSRIPKSILILDQPEKSRRCSDFIAAVVQCLLEKEPNLRISTYGSRFSYAKGVNSLGLVNAERLGDLYRAHQVGVSLSATNPSRVPFEMTACGMSVFDFDLPSTKLDYSDIQVHRVAPSPELFATSILNELENFNEVIDQHHFTETDESEEFERAFSDFLDSPVVPSIPDCSLRNRELEKIGKRKWIIKKIVPGRWRIFVKRVLRDFI